MVRAAGSSLGEVEERSKEERVAAQGRTHERKNVMLENVYLLSIYRAHQKDIAVTTKHIAIQDEKQTVSADCQADVDSTNSFSLLIMQ